MVWKNWRRALPVLVVIAASSPVWSSVGSGAAEHHSLVARPGVVLSADAKDHRFTYRADGDAYVVTYTSATVWSAGLEGNLANGWNVIVEGNLGGTEIAAIKVVNDPKPERTACKSDALTVDTAVQAFMALNAGKVPPSVASLTSHKDGGPYLTRTPGNRSFYRIALNWGGSPARENGGAHPGDVDVARAWLGSVGRYRDFTTEGAIVCNVAT